MTAKEQRAGWPGDEEKINSIAQASALREQAKKGGLRFEAYLPPALADWLLGAIEQGKFLDPGEAVFVILGEHKELEPYADLRRELLQRRLQSAMDDPRPGIPADEVFAKLDKMLAEPRPAAAVWEQRFLEPTG